MDTPITTLEEPRIDKYRETHIELGEYCGDDSRTLGIETLMTFDEMMEFVNALGNVTRRSRARAADR